MKPFAVILAIVSSQIFGSEEIAAYDRLFEAARARRTAESKKSEAEPRRNFEKIREELDAHGLRMLRGINDIAVADAHIEADLSNRALMLSTNDLNDKLKAVLVKRLAALPGTAFDWLDKTSRNRNYDCLVRSKLKMRSIASQRRLKFYVHV